MSSSAGGKGKRQRYGIAEWYGRSLADMGAEERRLLAEKALAGTGAMDCPWQSQAGSAVKCGKVGGVCSLRVYEATSAGQAVPLSGEDAGFCTTCPKRFYERGDVFCWVGEVVLGHANPVVLGEVGFLERGRPTEKAAVVRRVGTIDHVLVVPDREPLHWCALEMQAVYFSGASMSKEFEQLKVCQQTGIPFPAGIRRPDFRSSGPKRLMPQLQIKVPTLRRWARRMAVIVDRAFFEALSPMEEVGAVSSCDIAWFIVEYRETDRGIALARHRVCLTTLEDAVQGLTAGKTVTLEKFEGRIREKMRG